MASEAKRRPKPPDEDVPGEGEPMPGDDEPQPDGEPQPEAEPEDEPRRPESVPTDHREG